MAGGGALNGAEHRAVRLSAPAKLTVSLRVLDRFDDGYHEIEAEMVSLDLADTVDVDPDGEGLTIEADPETRAEILRLHTDNIVYRALEAAERSAGVHLVKRIPVNGGLGGGSADAAAILRWAGVDDPAVAARLGADVPFCVVGGRAAVGGIGDRVAPLPFEDRSFVLLVPPFGIDTGAVYRAWDYLAPLEPDGPNDLERPALEVEPRLARWRDLLAEVTGRRPVLAGSGSTWFVEGTPAEFGLEARASLTIDHEAAHLIAVRTVPSGWELPG